jgi:hypothetical protein
MRWQAINSEVGGHKFYEVVDSKYYEVKGNLQIPSLV